MNYYQGSFNIKHGDKLLSIRGSKIAFLMAVKRPIIESAKIIASLLMNIIFNKISNYMNFNKFIIIDDCRKNLFKYTFKAFAHIAKIDNPVILDIGCGTGVPTLALAENFSGVIYAVDSDKSSLTWLQKKIDESGHSNRIKIIHASINENYIFNINFDIILAEGFLNVIGFEKGLPVLVKHIKSKGYIIIHDEIKNDEQKKEIFKNYNLKLIESFRLDKNEWWDDYYSCLEAKINNLNKKSLFQNEISEINKYKNNPENFKSIYYILQFIA